MPIRLERMSSALAATILRGERPSNICVADDYPTEFSRGVAAQVAVGTDLGPYVIEWTGASSVAGEVSGPTMIVGEIGGALIGQGTVEIGYAVVRSHWGQGIATEAVRALVSRIRLRPDVRRVVAHTPLDRPESARVLQKAGFVCVGEVSDEHEAEVLRVKAWEFRL